MRDRHADSDVAIPAAARPAARWVLMALAILVGLVSLRGLLVPLEQGMAHVAHYLDGQRVALWVHILAGPLALLAVPIQISPLLRRRWPAVHRAAGRFYVLTCLAGGVGALAMLPGYQGSWTLGLGFAILGILWIGVTLRGFVAIRRGQVAQHRRWMVRSVALTAAAISLRLIMAPLVAAGWTIAETYEVTAWASWMVNLLIAEMILRRAGR